jgi:hypothetical protein
MNITDITNSIINGNCDGHLEDIREALHRREKRIGQRKMNTMEEGQSVWFSDESRPTYLIGVECKVVEIRRKRVVVRAINQDAASLGRFAGRIIAYPNHLLTTKPAYAR